MSVTEERPTEAAVATPEQITVKSLESWVSPDWCPGCGDFGVLKSVKEALVEHQIQPQDVMVVSGIGCSSNLPGFIKANGVHSLHGRALAVATGIKLANMSLHVLITGGDGDGVGIGCAHFVHAMRRNLDLNYFMMNNEIYGLTTGQASPTTMMEVRTKTTPFGCVEMPINPVALSIVSGATYVARTFAGDQKHMSKVFADAIAHPGFSYVDCLSPCITYNKFNTYQYFKERCYRLEDEEWDTSDPMRSLERSYQWGDKIPIGVFYQAERPTYEESDPVLQAGPLVDQEIGISQELFDELLADTM